MEDLKEYMVILLVQCEGTPTRENLQTELINLGVSSGNFRGSTRDIVGVKILDIKSVE